MANGPHICYNSNLCVGLPVFILTLWRWHIVEGLYVFVARLNYNISCRTSLTCELYSCQCCSRYFKVVSIMFSTKMYSFGVIRTPFSRDRRRRDFCVQWKVLMRFDSVYTLFLEIFLVCALRFSSDLIQIWYIYLWYDELGYDVYWLPWDRRDNPHDLCVDDLLVNKGPCIA